MQEAPYIHSMDLKVRGSQVTLKVPYQDPIARFDFRWQNPVYAVDYPEGVSESILIALDLSNLEIAAVNETFRVKMGGIYRSMNDKDYVWLVACAEVLKKDIYCFEYDRVGLRVNFFDASGIVWPLTYDSCVYMFSKETSGTRMYLEGQNRETAFLYKIHRTYLQFRLIRPSPSFSTS
jgi:hypothetical protein